MDLAQSCHCTGIPSSEMLNYTLPFRCHQPQMYETLIVSKTTVLWTPFISSSGPYIDGDDILRLPMLIVHWLFGGWVCLFFFLMKLRLLGVNTTPGKAFLRTEEQSNKHG